jgi:hypothetical protein
MNETDSGSPASTISDLSPSLALAAAVTGLAQ